MSEIHRLLESARAGDHAAADLLLPIVYDELRALATAKLARERTGQTLQTTALVHEAYIRLVGAGGHETVWDGSGHFFAAAAEAMRRILVENARRKKRRKYGGGFQRHDVADVELTGPELREDVLALDEALTKLANHDSAAAELVELRYFAGLALPEIARLLDISPRTADRLWAYARSWLRREIETAT